MFQHLVTSSGCLNEVSSIKLYLPLLRSLVVCDVPVSRSAQSHMPWVGGFYSLVIYTLDQEIDTSSRICLSWLI